MSLPPVFRLAALVALGAVVFRYSLAAQLCLAAGLTLMAMRRGTDSLVQIFRALRRIRWLLLSLAVIYLVIAPEPGPGGTHGFFPTWADFELAIRRAGVLVLLVAAVELMRQTTPPEEIAASIALLLSPLRWMGIDTARFSRRVALTLDAVPKTAEAVASAAGRAGIRGRNLAGWSEAAAVLIRDIEAGATHTAGSAHLPALPRPIPAEWFTIMALLGVIFGLLWV
ncbi:MAG: hypothetical protein PVJ48_07675 [Gammaproteobacteria bacterium]